MEIKTGLGNDGQAWPHSKDALLWAETLEGMHPTYDSDLMLGWFANYWAAVNDPLEHQLDKAKARIVQLEAERDALQVKYNELLMEVHAKIPDETRHETAKRIIHEHEHREQVVPARLNKGEVVL